ncbi:MAG: type II secretion system minor pseudopilin GspK [Gammaproteobacteria bacterium]|nr:type II secretion system minor pseudopilin GspK [Gammaproteobacteria bacterium]
MFLQRSYKSRTTLSNPGTSYSITGKNQQGVAIITALLIVTIATTVSITISTRLQLDVRRTSNMIAQDQAGFYLVAAEAWSQRILRQDKEDSTIDDLSEDWAVELPPLPVAGGSIQGKLTDLHRCININSLLEKGSVNATTENRLTQLFKNIGLDRYSTQAIADWIDSDLETSNPNGAEDGYYLNLEKPYRPANTTLQSISEIRLIKGFEDSKDYQQVKDHLCAFVSNDKLSINVNTASAEVLKSLSADMTDSLAKGIIEQREEKPFNDLEEFASFVKLDTITKTTKKLSTSSDYFLLRTQAIIGQANKTMYSIIYRDDSGKTEIISRVYRTL